MKAAAAALVALALAAAPVARADDDGVAALPGWKSDDPGPALAAFRRSCPQMTASDWVQVCAAAETATDAREFFESRFRVVPVTRRPALVTGYYEPEIAASPIRTARFSWPIYRKPPELAPGTVWFDRATIETRGLLAHRGLELAWLTDPAEAFFLQIQGSGRLRMPDGGVMRVGFAAKNNQPYRSVGREMVARGLLRVGEASAQAIKAWVRHNPEAGLALLRTNPSYVFFRKVDVPAALGPLGAMHLPLTPGRSLAVDPKLIPLGAPVWVAGGADRLDRLTVAQDKGTAIKGARADLFVGTGAAAGEIAGRMRDRGALYVLVPRATLVASAEESRQ